MLRLDNPEEHEVVIALSERINDLMHTASVPDVKQQGGRSSATVNCHDFIGVDSKLQRLVMSITKLPRADLQLVEMVITSLKSTDVQLTPRFCY